MQIDNLPGYSVVNHLTTLICEMENSDFDVMFCVPSGVVLMQLTVYKTTDKM